MDGSNVTELASMSPDELIRVMGFFCWDDTLRICGVEETDY